MEEQRVRLFFDIQHLDVKFFDIKLVDIELLCIQFFGIQFFDDYHPKQQYSILDAERRHWCT